MKFVGSLALCALIAAAVANAERVSGFGPSVPTHTETFATPLEFFSEASNRSPVQVATAFVQSKVDTASGLAFTLKNSYISDISNATHVYFKQTFNGVEIVNADFSVHVDKFGRIFSFSSSFFTGSVPIPDAAPVSVDGQLVLGQPAQPKQQLSPAEAVVKFAEFIQVPVVPAVHDLQVSLRTDDASAFPGNYEGEPASVVGPVSFVRDSAVPAMPKYIITGDSEETARLVQVWDMSVDLTSGDSWYNAQMDMETGQVLQLVDWVSEASYYVFPIGVNDPHDGNRSMIVNPEDKFASPLGWHNQGKPSRGSDQEGRFNTTIGNNVYAQLNPNGRNDYRSNYRPTGDKQDNELVFNYEIDFNDEPRSYVNASVTNLFYWNNVMHDVFYNYGFDEKSGNFQFNNLGRGGRDDDAVIANAQDGSGYNNANFATPPDGMNGRMRMYIWTVTKPARDGDLESGIVIHEYAHGISTRLTGGPANSNCLGYGEAGGMGEGWGDIFATMLRMRANYTSDIEFGLGDYSANRGIRPFPYSRSMQTNPHIYSYIRRSPYNSRVHHIGSVWASILYEVYWSFVDQHGFDANWYNIAGLRNGTIPANKLAGNIIMMQLLVEGMKIQPCRPTFVDARNAIMKADEVLFEGQHVCLLWKSFAKRGLGSLAKRGGYDSFDVPTECK